MTEPHPHPEAIKMAHERPGRPVASALYVTRRVNELEQIVDRVPGVAVVIAAIDPTTGETWDLWGGFGIANAVAFANEILTLADEAQ